ncbi:hypothetical protein BD779DRAFT_1207967 [Infundibulicybe gibba]|nr:hypothetical protein BD779DRAFT_1207967 [Infundibulicybe gibba]
MYLPPLVEALSAPSGSMNTGILKIACVCLRPPYALNGMPRMVRPVFGDADCNNRRYNGIVCDVNLRSHRIWQKKHFPKRPTAVPSLEPYIPALLTAVGGLRVRLSLTWGCGAANQHQAQADPNVQQSPASLETWRSTAVCTPLAPHPADVTL